MLHHQAPISAEEQRKSKTILVLEDNVEIADILVLALSRDPSDTPVLARTAQDVLPILTSRPVHLLLIAYELADRGCLALYDCLHAHAAFEHLPAILMSTSVGRHAQELAVRHLIGLSQPFDLDDLFETVKTALGEQGSREAGAS